METSDAIRRAELLEKRSAALKAKLQGSHGKKKTVQNLFGMLSDEALNCCIEFLSTYKGVMAVNCRCKYLANTLVAISVSRFLDGVFPIDCLGDYLDRPTEILDLRLRRMLSKLEPPVDPVVVCWYKAQLYFCIMSSEPVGGFSISDILYIVFPKHICGLRYALQRQLRYALQRRLEALAVEPRLVAIRILPHMFRDLKFVCARAIMGSDDLGFSVREVMWTLIDLVDIDRSSQLVSVRWTGLVRKMGFGTDFGI